jgi:hypothetical protein
MSLVLFNLLAQIIFYKKVYNVGGTGRFAKGLMNDCKIYDYALSDDEMNALLL